MKEINEVPINWESSGYSVLKNLNASILGVFCEFIDNSIQSHKNKKGNIRYSFGARNLFDIQNISTTGITNSADSQTHLSSDGLNLMSWGRSIVINIAWKFNKK